MKKDRNCGCGATPYPIYQMPTPMMPMGQMIPNQMIQGAVQMPMAQSTIPMMGQTNFQSTGIEQQLSSLNSQITNLERRVSTIENLIGSSNIGTNYNTSNFQMM